MIRFTIRDVLWLIVVVSLALGWWRSEIDRQSQIDSLADWIKTQHLAIHELDKKLNGNGWQVQIGNDGTLELSPYTALKTTDPFAAPR